MYTATLTFTKTEDGRIRLEWSDDDPISAFVTADTAEDALRVLVEHGNFTGEWLRQEAEELSTPAPVEQATLGLARRVAVAPDDIKTLVQDHVGTGNLLRIDYRDNEGVLTTGRLIEPRNTWTNHPATNWTYLRAYDHGRGGERTFRMDRIERAELVEEV